MQKKVLIALKMATVAGREKLSGIFRYLESRHDWTITLLRTAAEFTPERMRSALQEGYDGYIVSIPDTESSAKALAKSEKPTVVMDIHDPQLQARPTNILFIRNDPQEIGSSAALELMSYGVCQSYAFVHNPIIAEWSQDRLRYFRETLRDHGFWCHELTEVEGLQTLPRPVGVLAANDDRGFDVLEYCSTHHLKVPKDALVLGINNDAFICDNCTPPLSSIQPDFEQEGFLAASHLDRLMSLAEQGQSDDAQTLFVGVRQIVRRLSTMPYSSSGLLVQKAVAYIRKHALSGISVSDVVKHLRCSRRLADLRFRELQGKSIGESIIDLQLEEAKRLLRFTREPIAEIAKRCGYDSPSYLMTLFRRRMKTTMGDYRRRFATPFTSPAHQEH